MQTHQPLLRLTGGVVRHPDYRLAAPVDLEFMRGEPVAICGANGSGKSLIVAMLTRAQPLLRGTLTYEWDGEPGARTADLVRQITFRDAYAGHEPAYYQQRWNCADEQEFPTVATILAQARRLPGGGVNGVSAGDTTQLSAASSSAENPMPHADLLAETGIADHLHKPVNLLSSGELRRLQIAQMLLSSPRLLIVDNPYIGLDPAARDMLTRLLARLAERLTLLVVVSRPDDVPPFVRRMVYVRDRRVSPIQPVENYARLEPAILPADPLLPLPAPFVPEAVSKAETVIRFRQITIRYGRRTILHNLDWTVRRGEHWALTGENGAGKSTLLSLVCADNPQAYACDITLFGHRRGRGESIWDLKRHIGYVAPELFTTYRKPLPALDIVASGLRDTIGLYGRPSERERAHCLDWMRAFGAEPLATRNYLSLSSGEQRLVLLIRAFVKSPDLLILDEPFHGLDSQRRLHARRLIDRYMQQPGKTLVMVTHYAEELPACIDHRLVLRKQPETSA